ncbi:UNVERIFIED_CONTAM: hypothetical protein FKN15_067983 [Acipenser sinensis]
MANKAYCKLCKTTLNAKKSDLIKHANTAKHIECTKPFTDTRQVRMDSFASSSPRNVVAETEAFLALYIAEHSAVQSVDHLTELCRARFKDSHAPALKLHRSKCTAIINNVLGPHFVSEPVADVGEGPFSLLIDESNDISVIKVLGIVIRYFSAKRKQIVSRFLSAVELEDFTADGIVSALKNCIATLGLDLKKLTGIGTDNASVDFLKGDIRQHLDPRPQLGYEAEKAIREDAVPEAAKAGIRGRCVDFTVKLLEEIRNRLPDNIEILQQMSALSVGEALRHTKKPITELAEMFMTSPEEINQIEIQWRNIHHIQWEHVDNTEKFWCEVESYRNATGDKPFKELCNLALTILTLPHSNAQVERVFSQLNVVKTKLRNRLSLLTVNSILHIRYGLQTAGKKCYQYSLPSSMLRIIGTMESYSSESKQANPE